MKRSSDAEINRPRKLCRTTEFSTFQLYPTSKYLGSFPFFRQPKEIGSFSQDAKRKFRHNKQQLRYLRLPQNLDHVAYNLRAGYDKAILRDDTVKEYLDDLLRWVLQNQEQFVVTTPAPGAGGATRLCNDADDTATGQSESSRKPNKRLYTDFISWRGLLTKLLCTPYENRDGWQISVSLYCGTWYMCEFETDQRKEENAKQTSREKEMSYWGYKFEQYLTSDSANGKPDTCQPVNNNEAFASVVRSRLKKHSLVFGGEVDCCEENGSSVHYVELKTNRELYQQNNERNFKRFKLIKWWAQSFLLGLPKIIAGFRDDEGTVRRLQVFKTLEIPKMIRDIRDPWDPNVCFNFLDAFLQFVKDTVRTDDPSVAYVFRWNPKKAISVEECPVGSKFAFLPQWYTDSSQREEC